jgi:hypothetical protein
MKEANLHPKKELFFLALLDLFLVILSFFAYQQSQSVISIGGFGLVIVLADYFFLGRGDRLLKAQKEKFEAEFVHIFAYFSIFIENGFPVYPALSEAKRFASPALAEKMGKLLQGIDEDKTVTPFLAFAEIFPSLEIRQVMISIYKMAEEGGGEAYIRQFQTIFASLASQKRKDLLGKTKSRLEGLCFLPLIDSGVTMGLIVIGIVIVIGDLVNGL